MAGYVTGLGKVSEDVREVGGVHRALRFLARNGVIQLVFVSSMVRSAVPRGFNGDGAMEGCVGAPLI